MKHLKIPVEGMTTSTDKRSRLAVISQFIQDGTILFPKQGAEELIQQLIGFGVEKNDDLVDALTLLVNKILEDNKPMPQIFFLEY